MSVILVSALVPIGLGVFAWWWLIHSTAPEQPRLAGTLSSGKIYSHDSPGMPAGSREGSFTSYVPSVCPRAAPLLVVLHGSNGSAEQIRRYTGFEFERLAEAHKFIVVYPEGYRGYWNDVRIKGGYAAKQQNVDDVSFLRALIESFRQSHGVGAVFGVGYSNGGQMCIRMALDLPGSFDAMALIAANMPTSDNSTSPPLDRPLPVMIVNGTDDPINPYAGGHVTIFGFGDRGTVLSTTATAEYFAAQLGSDVSAEGPSEVLPRSPETETWVERRTWRASVGREVVLYTVHRGGHVVPQPHYKFFRLVGRTEMRLNAPAECWAFFQRAGGMAGERR